MDRKNEMSVVDVVAKVAAEVRKYMPMVSSQLEGACLRHAEMGQQFLNGVGIETRLVIGEAAWRVGNGVGDAIAHTKKCNTSLWTAGDEISHAWLEHDGHIIDFTTYTLPVKARMMDALDGNRTNVLWCPDYLYAPKSDVSSYPDVRDKHAGMFHYRRNSALEQSVLRRSESFAEMHEFVSLLREQTPDLKVFVVDAQSGVTEY